MCVDGEEVKNHGCGVRRGVSFYEQDLEFSYTHTEDRFIHSNEADSGLQLLTVPIPVPRLKANNADVL